MIENLLVGLIITGAIAFLTRKIWRKKTCSKGACGCATSIKVKAKDS